MNLMLKMIDVMVMNEPACHGKLVQYRYSKIVNNWKIDQGLLEVTTIYLPRLSRTKPIL